MDAQLGLLWRSDKTKTELVDLKTRMDSLESRFYSTEDGCKRNIELLGILSKTVDRDADLRISNFSQIERRVADLENSLQSAYETIENMRIQLHAQGIELRPTRIVSSASNGGIVDWEDSDAESCYDEDSFVDSPGSGDEEDEACIGAMHGVDRVAQMIIGELEKRGWNAYLKRIVKIREPNVIVLELSQMINGILEHYRVTVMIRDGWFDGNSTAYFSRYFVYNAGDKENESLYRIGEWIGNECPSNEGILENLVSWLGMTSKDHDPRGYDYNSAGSVKSVVSSSDSDSPRPSGIPVINNMENVLDYVEQILSWGNWRFEKKSDKHDGNDHIVMYTIHNSGKLHGNQQEYLMDIMISHSDSEITVSAQIRPKNIPLSVITSWNSDEIAASVSSWQDHDIKHPIREESSSLFKVEESFESWIREFIDNH